MTATITAIDVYRRDGCGFCVRLERFLHQSDLPVRYHDIWSDPEAAAFVRAHNRGAETVPTVAVADRVMTNPSAHELVATIEEVAPDLLAEARP